MHSRISKTFKGSIYFVFKQMFRWHLNHDIDLAKEVVSLRPASSKNWDNVAENLEAAWPKDPSRNKVKGRSCKEHFEVMMAHHKEENQQALRKSGTEEEYSELQQLLDDVIAYQLTEKQDKKSDKKKDVEDRKKGLAFRDASMKSLSKKSPFKNKVDSDESSDEEPGPSKKKAKTRTKRPDVFSFLQEKNEAQKDYRDRELKYKENALELERRRIEIQEKNIALQNKMLLALTEKKEN
ncbi:uncharacterized protein LOC110239808 [Exaiptasia diaphana]|uniref:Uncharacterized protein n=1 Tax=Exaiptasia diaphana TaxID=2652724 RepID=A0A913X9N2_EXADI|nr:uncharacterized protein LOC110239808 [Exaiptasia diaphana]